MSPRHRATKAEIEAREARVVELRLAGLPFESIAHRVPEVTDRMMATRDYARWMARSAESRSVARPYRVDLELDRVDQLERQVRAVMAGAQGVAQPDGSIRGGDPKLVLESVDRLLKLSRRREELQDREQPDVQGDPIDEIAERRRRKLGMPQQF